MFCLVEVRYGGHCEVPYLLLLNPDLFNSFVGGATNSHSGNRAFRSLVKRYQDQYLKAKKRDKPTVASISKRYFAQILYYYIIKC